MDPQGAGWGDDRGGHVALAAVSSRSPKWRPPHRQHRPCTTDCSAATRTSPRKWIPTTASPSTTTSFGPNNQPGGDRHAVDADPLGCLWLMGYLPHPAHFGRVPWGRGPAGAPTIRTPFLGNIEDGGLLHNPTCRCWWPAARSVFYACSPLRWAASPSHPGRQGDRQQPHGFSGIKLADGHAGEYGGFFLF